MAEKRKCKFCDAPAEIVFRMKGVTDGTEFCLPHILDAVAGIHSVDWCWAETGEVKNLAVGETQWRKMDFSVNRDGHRIFGIATSRKG